MSVLYRAAESLAGAWGKFFKGPLFQNFFRTTIPPSPRRQLFREKIFRPSTLPQFFIPNFGTLPKKTNFLPFARKYFFQKNDWGPTKNFQGPPEPGGPGQFVPPPPAALVLYDWVSIH
jgi:hypothetical protein